MNGRTEHTHLAHLQAGGEALQIGGHALAALAAICGGTPFYAYSRDLVNARVRHLRAHLPDAIALHYAIKANPYPALVQHLGTLVDGFDVASQQELRIALDTGKPATAISFAGPGKRRAEILAAVAAGVTINAESIAQVRAAAEAGETLGIRPRVALRINPDFELKGSGMKMTGSPSQFGIDADQAGAALQAIADHGIEFRGLHLYAGSQNLRAAAIIEANDRSFELALRLCEQAPGPAAFLNIGGGFGIPYFPGDEPLDIAPIGAGIAPWLPRVRDALGSCEIIIELGRYLVGEAGYYVCRVLERKESRGRVFLVCDGGLHHHLANSGNFGQVLRRNYPVVIGNRLDARDTETVSIVGPLCTPLDIIADNVTLPRAEVDDFVVVAQSGAYGRSASPAAFLGHPEAVEILV